MREAHARGDALKLSEDELAFYDALETNDSAVNSDGLIEPPALPPHFPMQKAGLSCRALICIHFRERPDPAWTHSWTQEPDPSPSRCSMLPWLFKAAARTLAANQPADGQPRNRSPEGLLAMLIILSKITQYDERIGSPLPAPPGWNPGQAPG
ncbi:MAG: DUF3387 domain-containing protein [Anaerolineae bacterium]|nr:DUF3387 domain-containing protein [Anaerolineae bacterium]